MRLRLSLLALLLAACGGDASSPVGPVAPVPPVDSGGAVVTPPAARTAAITITFDDGWKGVFTYAYPMLAEMELRANVGVITSVNWSGVMSVAQLRVLQRAGWSVVSHSETHPYLTQLPMDSARAELLGSRRVIDSLGFNPRVFLFPYLDHSDATLAEAQAASYAYSRCCVADTWTTDTLVDWPISDAGRYRIAGVDVTHYDGQETTYDFKTWAGRERLRTLLRDVVTNGKFIDVMFHDVTAADTADLRAALAIIAEHRPYLVTYDSLP